MKKSDKAIIFDIDGTLWDASNSCSEGWSLGLKKLGIDSEISAEQIRSVMGKPYDECVRLLLGDVGVDFESVFEVVDIFERRVLVERGGDFYKGAIEGIKRLSEDFEVYLVSNCQDWYLDVFLKHSGLRDFLSGCDCFGRSHWHKEKMLRRIITEGEFSSGVYVGDTQGDLLAADKAGLDFIYARYGMGSVEFSDEEMSFDSFDEVFNFLFNMR